MKVRIMDEVIIIFISANYAIESLFIICYYMNFILIAKLLKRDIKNIFENAKNINCCNEY